MLAEPRPGGGRRRQLTFPAPRAVGQAHGEADGERAAQGTLLPARWPGGVAARPRSAHTHGQRENSRARAGEQLSCEGDAPTGAERGAQRRGAGPPPWRPGRGSATTTLEFRCFRKCFLLKVNFRYHKTSPVKGPIQRPSVHSRCVTIVPIWSQNTAPGQRDPAGVPRGKTLQNPHSKREEEKHIAPREISSSCALTYQGSRSCPFMLNCGYIFICRGLTATQHGHQGAGESQTP